jgi:hypothetical protein
MTDQIYGPRHGEECHCGGCQHRRAEDRRRLELHAVRSFGRALASLGRQLRGEPAEDDFDRAVADLKRELGQTS